MLIAISVILYLIIGGFLARTFELREPEKATGGMCIFIVLFWVVAVAPAIGIGLAQWASRGHTAKQGEEDAKE